MQIRQNNAKCDKHLKRAKQGIKSLAIVRPIIFKIQFRKSLSNSFVTTVKIK